MWSNSSENVFGTRVRNDVSSFIHEVSAACGGVIVDVRAQHCMCIVKGKEVFFTQCRVSVPFLRCTKCVRAFHAGVGPVDETTAFQGNRWKRTR